MNQLLDDPPRPLSVWSVNSDEDTYTSGLREVETVSEPLVTTSLPLIDPPRQFDDILKELDPREIARAAEDEADAEKKELLQQVDQFCRPANRKEVETSRLAPSIDCESQQVNTVEIVKKDGMYSVVLDGVSQGVIGSTYDPQTGKTSFNAADYWLPRFKETMARSQGMLVRTTRPVVFSMRLEDYEGVPESCHIHVLQRVVNGGTVIMDNKEVKKETITPYSTGSAASEVVVLPYPLISTPEPHFHINDYSRMREAEITVKVSQDVGLLSATKNFLARVAGSVTPGSGESGPRMIAQDFANWAAAVRQATGKLVSTAAGAAGAGAAVSTGVAGVAAATEAAGAATSAAGAAASLAGVAAPAAVAPVVAGGAIGGLGVFMVWEMLSSSRKLEKWTVTTADRQRLLGMHEQECTKEPKQHRITISELPKILRRISETRANGSVVSGTDQTIGMSVHDLNDIKWRKEAAFLHWLQYGEGPRFDGSSLTARTTAMVAASVAVAGAGVTTAAATSEAATAAAAAYSAGSVGALGAAAASLAPYALGAYLLGKMLYAIAWTGDEWASQLSSYQTPPDPITGRYSLQQNIQQNNDLRERPQLTPLTGNTISRAGMDPLTLSNTRTQFSFTIKIVESDGQPGPTINLEATRMNGIDAGWVSAGYDDLINTIRQEVDCLEFKLMSMTSVTSWMRRHSTLVADSNNGAIVGDKFDMQVNQAIDRELGDLASASTPEKIEAAAKREKKRSEKASKQLEASRKALAKANKNVATVKSDQRKWDEKYNEKVRNINNAANLDAARRQRRLDAARQTYDRGKERLARNLRKRETTAMEKDDDARNSARVDSAQTIREKRAGLSRKFANIFDYEELLKRLRVDVLGDEYDVYTVDDAAADIERMREQRVSQRSYWTRIKDALLPMFLRSRDAEDIGYVRDAIEQHKQYCIGALSSSLGVRSSEIRADSVLHLRFTEIFSPVVTKRRQLSMRFASFIVPGVGVWLRPPTRDPESIVRMLPQIVVFSTSLVSAFGNVKILQPLSLTNSELVEEQTLGKNTVRVMDLTLRRVSNLYDVPRMLIWQNVCHMIQIYKRRANWVAGYSTVFVRSLDTTRSSADLMAMAALPTKTVRKSVHVAVAAGGDNMRRHNHVTAGNKVYGAGKLLAELGCERGHGGLLAVATFSEILAFHVLQYGASAGGGKGFLLQYRELVDNVKSKSRQAAQIVAKFITTYYTSSAKKPRRMVFNDVAFYCLPGMSYVRIALRRIGLLEDLDRSNTVFVEWNRDDRRFANDFANSLLKLASSSNIDPSVFPFTCAQSVVGGVPAAIKSSMGTDYADSVSAQIATLCHAYKRIQIMTNTVKAVSGERNVVCIRVDCICSRPIVLKTVAMYRSKTIQIIERVGGQSPQASWSKPRQPFNSTLLQHRLAGMRMNVEEDVLRDAVQTPAASGKTHRELYDELVDTMSGLDVRGLVDIGEPDEATFMVPFGVYSMGTTADIACMDFEMRPVWVADLKAAAIRVGMDITTPPTTATDVTIRMDGSTLYGRPRHPFVVVASKTYVAVYVDDESSKNAAITAPPPSDSVDTDRLVDALTIINKDPAMSELSGELSERYRSIMHNAERVFQACLVIASGKYHGIPPSKGILAQVDLSTTNVPAANLAVSVCIGNALAFAATGMPIRVVASSPTQDAQRHQDMALAAVSVESACDALMRNGVAAVPFSEACCSFSCLSV